ncbi:MAG TPA: ATP-dependent zinc metalloprotease FtsH [Candidatus Omnitrophota bacterium]|nr:ATP-dependent zinc metalloprotease FtsH [Candidatus Omnitrophota bacterium]HPD85261.1 ATP-dependent zinc metalloprotease FtsH [Candidatus Omnitrophota bacterium]HRZ04238.1 ATP-dependent zinc metalloprotease FtsH [Candidatus Omnitrophota bacterium]
MAEPNKNNSKRPSGKPSFKMHRNQNGYWLWIFFIVTLLFLASQTSNPTVTVAPKEISYSEFYALVKDNPVTKTIEVLTLTENRLEGTLKDGSKFNVHIPANDTAILDVIRTNVSNFTVVPPKTFWSTLFMNLWPTLIFILFFWFLYYRSSQMGNKIWSFGKSKAKINDSKNGKVTFADVAGVDEAKEELQEVIEFLKDPKKFQKLGGKIPKGVLLIGFPGTGKTLLAKAVAGEAGVPFFSLSGSDFVEMFVGVGASRVRDLFEQGRKTSKASGKGCIIFIDEIDAVGRLRFSGIGGGHDEREQTLNALLVEMDGFDTQKGLIVVAATNRPDTLDPALLRPGRFDRQIVVPLPDILGREAILKVHSKNIKVADNVDFKAIARQTVYFSGADLANVCNEAALLAARKNKESIGMPEFLAAVERVTMGPEKKSRVTSKKDKEITAFHESGHALLSLLVEGVDTFTKVSIIPRGMAGGYTLTPPSEDRHYWSKKHLFGIIVVSLGGRVAEEIMLGEITSGASQDLQQATQIARDMVCRYGMSNKLGTLTFGRHHEQVFLGRDFMEQKDYSEQTAKVIDEEISSFIDEAHKLAKKLLTDNRDKLETLARRLIEKEVIDIDEARALLGMPAPVEPAENTSGQAPTNLAQTNIPPNSTPQP